MSKANWEHLVRNVPNTEENRKFIKDVNKMSKESDSYYKLFIKYRKPKKGFKYGSGGSLRCENANAFSVYIADRRPYGSRPIDNAFNVAYKRGRKITELEDKITELEREISIYRNPYYNWSFSDLEDKLNDIKDKMVTRCLEIVEPYSFNIESLRKEYLLVNEILLVKEKELRRDRV